MKRLALFVNSQVKSLVCQCMSVSDQTLRQKIALFQNTVPAISLNVISVCSSYTTLDFTDSHTTFTPICCCNSAILLARIASKSASPSILDFVSTVPKRRFQLRISRCCWVHCVLSFLVPKKIDVTCIVSSYYILFSRNFYSIFLIC